MTRRRLLPVVLVVLALVVNYQTTAGLLTGGAASPTSEPLAEGAWPEASVPTPAGPELAAHAGSTFQPAQPSAELTDPFLRVAEAAPTEASATATRALLPQVSMILRSRDSRRAVIDRNTVGVGDKVSNGVVTAIEADHVMVQTASGSAVRLALPDIRARRRTAKADGTPSAADAKTPSLNGLLPKEQATTQPLTQPQEEK